MVQKAKEEAQGLLDHVKSQYEEFKARGPSRSDRHQGGYGHGGHDRHHSGNGAPSRGYDSNNYGQYGGYSNGNAYGQGHYNQNSYGSTESGTEQAQVDAGQPDYSEQWKAYYEQLQSQQKPTGEGTESQGQDPYAAYGGYEAYMNWYQQYYQAQYAADQSAASVPPPDGAVPAPPSGKDDAAPPPPPPPPGAAGSINYSHVPPPPGM
jgi:hypothetical protein